MSFTIFFAVIAFVAVGWYIVTGIIIFHELQKRGEKVYFIFLNFMLPAYASRYKKITVEETGKVGSLFYHWIISINMALIFTIATLAIKYW